MTQETLIFHRGDETLVTDITVPGRDNPYLAPGQLLDTIKSTHNSVSTILQMDEIAVQVEQIFGEERQTELGLAVSEAAGESADLLEEFGKAIIGSTRGELRRLIDYKGRPTGRWAKLRQLEAISKEAYETPIPATHEELIAIFGRVTDFKKNSASATADTLNDVLSAETLRFDDVREQLDILKAQTEGYLSPREAAIAVGLGFKFVADLITQADAPYAAPSDKTGSSNASASAWEQAIDYIADSKDVLGTKEDPATVVRHLRSEVTALANEVASQNRPALQAIKNVIGIRGKAVNEIASNIFTAIALPKLLDLQKDCIDAEATYVRAALRQCVTMNYFYVEDKVSSRVEAVLKTAHSNLTEESTQDDWMNALEVELWANSVADFVSSSRTSNLAYTAIAGMSGPEIAEITQTRERLKWVAVPHLHNLLTIVDVPEVASPSEAERLDELNRMNAFVELRDAAYTLTNKQLRASDNKLQFTNAVRLGQNSDEENQPSLPSTDPDFAKGFTSFLFALEGDAQKNGTEGALDKLIEMLVSEESFSFSGLGRLRPVLGEYTTWLQDNQTALLASDDVPVNIKQLIREIDSYQKAINGESPNEEIVIDVEHIDPVVEEPEDDKTEVSELPVELFAQARLLDVRVFPPGADITSIRKDFEDNVSPDISKVDWFRVAGLVELRDEFANIEGVKSQLFRGKPGSLATSLPYYVLVLDRNNQKIVIAENPEYGNATYMFQEDPELAGWEEMVALPKAAVRELGGVRFVHSAQTSPEFHVDKIRKRIIAELTVGA